MIQIFIHIFWRKVGSHEKNILFNSVVKKRKRLCLFWSSIMSLFKPALVPLICPLDFSELQMLKWVY